MRLSGMLYPLCKGIITLLPRFTAGNRYLCSYSTEPKAPLSIAKGRFWLNLYNNNLGYCNKTTCTTFLVTGFFLLEAKNWF